MHLHVVAAPRISTHSSRAGKRHHQWAQRDGAGGFQPTLPAQGRDCNLSTKGEQHGISTHSSRAGKRHGRMQHAIFKVVISTHSSRAGKRHAPVFSLFLTIYFNPLFPRREETDTLSGVFTSLEISTHSSRAGKRHQKSPIIPSQTYPLCHNTAILPHPFPTHPTCLPLHFQCDPPSIPLVTSLSH